MIRATTAEARIFESWQDYPTFGRALPLHRTLGKAAALTPLLQWEAAAPPRTANELRHRLDLTWQVITI